MKKFSALKKKSKVDRSKGKDYIKTVERLITILSELDKGKSVATALLAEELGVTQRTIQRDVSLLSRCGYPLYETMRGRYAFVEGFSLRKVALSEEQASLLSFLCDIASSLGVKFEESFQELFRKLMANNLDTPFYAKVQIGHDQLSDSVWVKSLEKAIDETRRVNIRYLSLSKGESEYILEPLKIAMFDGFWYLIAQVKGSSKVQKFRMDRVKKVEDLQERFTPSVDINKMLKQSVNIWFDGARGEQVQIKVASEAAHYFRKKDYFPLQKIVAENKDGSIVLETYPAHPEEIMHTIMHWIPWLKVIAPESLKNEVKKTVASYLNTL